MHPMPLKYAAMGFPLNRHFFRQSRPTRQRDAEAARKDIKAKTVAEYRAFEI